VTLDADDVRAAILDRTDRFVSSQSPTDELLRAGVCVSRYG